jgi:putative FmdB family regulatory protein
MPTYQYECQSCKQRYEEILKIAEMEKPCGEPCPKCGKIKIEKKTFDAPLISSGVQGQYRLNSDFKDHLKAIDKFYGDASTVNVP